MVHGDALPSGVHKVKIVYSPSNSAGGYINVDAVDVLGELLGAGRIEQSDSRLAYAGTWATYTASGASAGAYRRAASSGASVTVNFYGVSLSWLAVKGTSMGKAWVSVDDGPKESINLYASTVAYQQKVWTTPPDLPLGDHQVKIWRDDTSAAGKFVSVDAFEVTGTIKPAYLWRQYQQNDVRMLYRGTWATISASGALSGSYKRASSTSAALDFAFAGSSIDLIATIGPGMGKADISVDGGPAVRVDFSSDTTLYRQKVWSSGPLAAGTHRIKISVIPGNPAGAYVDYRCLQHPGEAGRVEHGLRRQDHVGGAAPQGALLPAGRRRRGVRLQDQGSGDRLPEVGGSDQGRTDR